MHHGEVTITLTHEKYQELTKCLMLTHEQYPEWQFERDSPAGQILGARQALGMSTMKEHVLSDYNMERDGPKTPSFCV